MLIALIAILLCGTANFAMHRWMLECAHPVVRAASERLRRLLGRHATYIFEFALLLLALVMAESNWFPTLMLYGVYTALNAATVAWVKSLER